MRKRRKEPMSVFTAIVLLLVGIFIGSVFIFGQQYWHREIQKEEAIEVSASFRSFRVVYGRHDVLREVKINFEDHEPYYIDKPCVTEELLDALAEIEKGTEVQMLVHPNSDTIWEFRNGDENNCIVKYALIPLYSFGERGSSTI